MKATSPSIKDYLYEEPGPKTKSRIRILTTLSFLLLLALGFLIIRQFYITGQLKPRYWSFFLSLSTWRFLSEGLWGTLKAAIVGTILAFFIGLVLMLGRIHTNKVVSTICVAFIEFFRGVPTLLLIYFFFLVIPQLGFKITAFWKITTPVALSASGVVAEVLRGGINAVAKGQKEAALSLGLTERKAFSLVIFPQALRYVLPSLVAEIVIVLKDTTFAYVVTYNDLMQNAMVMISNHDALLSIYLVVAIIYILINYLLNRLALYLNHRSERFSGIVVK